jgi:hypothetical protein
MPPGFHCVLPALVELHDYGTGDESDKVGVSVRRALRLAAKSGGAAASSTADAKFGNG